MRLSPSPPSLRLPSAFGGLAAGFLLGGLLLIPAAAGEGSAPPAAGDGSFSFAAAAAAAEPRLVLRAPRQLMLRPRMPGEMRRPSLSVEVSARLEDLDTADNPEDYYCLEEVWDWDDDTESVYEPDCDPWEEGSEVETFFFASHRFSLPGTYRVWLRLQRSGETVVAGNVTIRIRN